jgi:concanavalin A-like lectin/glucanase superfamily protein/galactose oxidase-like protein/Big-like domain-containing protein/IPT/TIG domain-containing protein
VFRRPLRPSPLIHLLDFALVCAAALAACPSASLAQTNGLVAAYSFNEGSGTTVTDLSGNNLNGTIVGATWTTAGKYGNALSFNGTSNYIDLGNPALLRLTGSMTIEAWIQATANPPDDGQIIAKSDGQGGWQFKTSPDTGAETFGIAVTGSSGSATQRYSTTVRALNTWYHVAGVYNAATGTMDFYVNGVLSTGVLRGASPIPTAQVDEAVNVNIGRRIGGYYFAGIIDEIRIYNRALSQVEIQTDMSTPLSGSAPPPDTTPPTVSMTAPASGTTVSGTTTISANASDNIAVAGVQFLLDGANLGSEVTTSPYNFQWNTSTTTAGLHTLAAIARDTSNNTTTSANISVTVQGPPPSQVGQWSTVMNWPIVAVHASLLPTGDVLAWTDYTINEGSEIWRVSTNTFTPKPETDVSLFCAGHAYLPDGRLLVDGGIVGLTDDLGPRNATIFDPATESWSQGALMFTGRYYPTATALPDGRILVQGGTTTCSTCIADMPEIYNSATNTWTQLAASARMAFKYYPHVYVMPDGRILAAAEDDKAISSQILDLGTQTWSTVDSNVFDGHSSVMYLPGKIMKAGTATADNPGLPAAATTYVLDMTQQSPAWQSTAPMAFPRSYLNLTILPDGQVLATGGSTTTDKANAATAVYAAELWSPTTKSWTTLSSAQIRREYHSTALLMPDARVLVAGGGRENGRSQPDPNDQMNAELFSPPYLFKGPRPVISSAPSTIQYNTAFAVTTPDFARIASVSLIGLSAVTHAFNQNQRFVPVSFTTTANGLSIQAPPNGNLAPPGPYMLFLVDNTGVPSVAAMVNLPAAASGASAPHITSLSATAAPVGTLITITGSHFGASQGSSTVTFNAGTGVPSSWSDTSIVVPVPSSATNGNVVVSVAGSVSNGVGFTVLPPVNAVGLVQHSTKDAGTATSTTLAFNTANSAGNFILVSVRASGNQTYTVSDSRGNTYKKAVQFNETVDGTTLGLFYAENIFAGANTVTVSDTVSGTLRMAIFEYTGVATASSLDGTATGQGTSATPVSGTVTTTSSGDLLIGMFTTANPSSPTAGTGYVIRETVPASPGAKLIVEDRVQTAAGAINAGVTLAASDTWGAALATFKAASGGGVLAPSISTLTPTAGAVGSPVTIAGANFGSSQGASTVTFNGTLATPTGWTATSIAVTVPVGATSGNVVVTVGGIASNGALFNVTQPAPVISGVAPNPAAIGQSVTISGSNFGSSQGASTVKFNGTAAAPSSWSDTSIAVSVPNGATSGNVVVTVGGTASNGFGFTVTNPGPSITLLNPTSGPVGTPVVITGANFGNSQGASAVTFNNTAATPTAWTATSISVPVPVGATSGNVVVTVGGVPSNGSPFNVTSTAPSITTLSATSGSAGTPITITGINFGNTPGTSTVTFNGTVTTPTSWNATTIVAPVPVGATTGPVVVSVGGVASNGVNFTVTAPPAAITLVQHASVDAGSTNSTTLAFAASNTAGNWIGVVARASNSGQVFNVSDSHGNIYKKAVQLNETVDGTTVAIYYAENITVGPNAVTVSDSIGGTLRIAIFEYAGVAFVNSLDVFSSAQGTSAAPATAAVTTTKNGDLLLGAISTANPATFAAGTNFTIRERVPASGSKLAAEDRVQATAGSATASATLSASDNWGAVLAAFAAASATPPPPISVSVAPSSANVTSGGAPQTFNATVQNDLQNKGVNWSLSGAGCSGAACGTLTGVTTTAATYNAPASIPVPATVTLTAVSVADNTKSSSATITILQGTVGVTITPKAGAITTSQSLALSAVVTSDVGGAGVNWSTTGGTLANQTSSSATFSSSAPGSFAVTATSKNDSTKTATVIVGVTDLAGVTTYHNNLSRDGSNPREYALAPSTVNSSTFGKLFSCPVDGAVYAQPLWVPRLAIAGGTHNVIFVATQHDSLYAFDADATTCTQFWKASMLDAAHGAAAGATPVDPNDVSELGDISGEIGITGTPVIDPVARTLFVVSKTTEGSTWHQRLHALNLADGTDRVAPKDLTSAITVPGTADRGDSSIGCSSPANNVPFCSLRENQRPGLVLANGLIYVAWGSHGDISPYHGWVMSFDPTTLALVQAFNTSPNGRQGGIWMAGAAPAVDNAGNLYFITGNGDLTADTVAPPNADYGDSFLKLSSGLSVVDWFSPFDQSNLDSLDLDLGSGGAAILVDLPPSAAVPRLIVGGGKGTGFDGEIYVINRDNLGHFNSTADSIVQEFPLGSGIFATAAFWQNRLYIASAGRPLKSFVLDPLASTFTTTPSSQSAINFGFPGVTPSVSSSGAANGIVWAIDSSANGKSDTNPTRVAGPAVLHAYDATNLAIELWNSTQGAGNTAGNAVKFTVPTVANGRVFIGTRGNDSTQGSGTVFGQLDVYGLLPN